MKTLLIERGIASPTPRHKTTRWPLKTMAVGESVFYPSEGKTNRPHCAVAHYRKIEPDKRYAVRRVDGGYRIWRVA